MSEMDLHNIEFVDEQERMYFAEAQLGLEVRSFLTSKVGRLLHGRAKKDYEDAKNELIELQFPDPDKERAIRQRAAVASSFMRWCAEAIQIGDAAEQQLETYRA